LAYRTLHFDTITPWPTLKSPASATVIWFDPAVVVAVVSNFDPDAPQSVTLNHADAEEDVSSAGATA
jgi:hypothetical protein